MAATQLTFALPIRRRGIIIAYSHVLNDSFTQVVLCGISWTLSTNGYAWHGSDMYLHRLIYAHYKGSLPPGRKAGVDHIDRDKLNNVPDNLRLASKSLNAVNSPRRRTNTSGYVGVYRATKGCRWVANITVNNRRIYLGCFKTPREGADVVNAAYRIHFPDVPIPNP